jgi:Spy/CpxP family protein refolding chaperone
VSEAPQDRDHDGHKGNFKPAKGGGFAEVPAEQPKITAAQRDKIVELITAAKIKEQNFCTKYGIGQIGMLPAELFDAAVKAIADHVEAAKAASRG